MRPRARLIAAAVIATMGVLLMSALMPALGSSAARDATLSSTSTVARAVGSAGSTLLSGALSSLGNGAGPADGASWSCSTTSLYSSRCSSTLAPAVQGTVGASAPAVAPSVAPAISGITLNWTNVTGHMYNSTAWPTNYFGAAVAYDPLLGEVVLFGDSASGFATNDVWLYSGSQWVNMTLTYAIFGSLPSAIQFATLTWDPQWSGLLLSGGMYASGVASTETWFFNGAWTNETVNVSSGPAAVYGNAAYDPLFGLVEINGCPSSNCTLIYGQTWVLGGPGSTWVNDSLALGVPDVYDFGSQMAYDVVDGVMVFFGGEFYNFGTSSFQYANSTWILTGIGWENITTTSSGQICIFVCSPTYPTPAAFGAMTWDGQIGAIVMFGGFNNTGFNNVTWVYSNGTGWLPAWWAENFAIANPAGEVYGVMPTDSSYIAPLMVGGIDSYFALGSSNASWVLEIPPQPVVTAVTPNPVDTNGTAVADVTYNWAGSGSGPSLTWAMWQGFFVDFQNGTANGTSFTAPFYWSGSFTFPSYVPGTYTIYAAETDFFGVYGFNYTDFTVNSSLVVTPSPNPVETELVSGAAMVHFSAGVVTGGTPAYSYLWSFGDLTPTSLLASPYHNYTAAGSYTASLNVTDVGGGFNNTSIPVTVYPALVASATSNVTATDVNLPVAFTGSATEGKSGYTYAWTFGDGGTSTSQNPSHTYATAAPETVTLTVTDALGFTATSSFSLTVNPALVGTLTLNTNSTTTGTTIYLNASKTGGTGPYTYAWNFGDSSSGTLALETHSYASAGTYTVSLTITDAMGQHVTKTATVTVSNPPSTAFSLTSGTGLYILIAVIVVIAALLAAALVMRRRRKSGPASTPAEPSAPTETTPPEGGAPPGAS